MYRAVNPDQNLDRRAFSALIAMWQQSSRHVEIGTDCKIWLQNLRPITDDELRRWLYDYGWTFPIPPKLVSKGDQVMALRASGTVLCRRPSFWDGDGVEVVGEQDQLAWNSCGSTRLIL